MTESTVEKKLFVGRIFFNLTDMEDNFRRDVMENIAQGTEKYGVKGIEWYKNTPLERDNMEYNSALITAKVSKNLFPRREDVRNIMKVLERTPEVKRGEGQTYLSVDVILPPKRSFANYPIW